MTVASNAGQSGAGPIPALTLPTQAPSPPHPLLLLHCDVKKGTGNHCREKRKKRGEEKRTRGREDGSLNHTQEGDRQVAQRKATPRLPRSSPPSPHQVVH